MPVLFCHPRAWLPREGSRDSSRAGQGRRAGMTKGGVAALVAVLLVLNIPRLGFAAPMGWGGGGGGGGGGSGTVNSGTSGQMAYYGASGTAVSGSTIGGDCTFTGPRTFICTKTSGTAFAASATTDTTNAGNIASGTLPAGRMPALTGDCTTSAGAVATTCTKTNGSAFAASATTDTTNAANIGSGTLPAARLPALNLCTDYPAPGSFAPTWTAGHTYCLGAGTYTIGSAQAVNVANVGIHCTTKAAILQRTGTTDGLDVTAAGFDIEGCTLDGNSQSGSGTGPLINLNGANDAVVRNNYFQNTGTTNAQKGTIWVQAGLRDKILDNSFTGSQTDTAVWVNSQSGSNSVQDLTVAGNKIPGFAPVTSLYPIDVNQNTGNVTSHTTVDDNLVINTNTHGHCPAWHGPAAVQNTNMLGNDVSRNQCYFTAEPAGDGFHLFGFSYGVVADNIVDDGGNGAGAALLNLGDIYNTTVTGNEVDGPGSLENLISCVDCSYNTFSANTLDGLGNGDVGILIESNSGPASNNAITGNHIRETHNSTGIQIQSDTGSFATSNNNVTANVIVGANSNSSPASLGIAIVDTTGTLSNTQIANNVISGFGGTSNVCISVGSGAANTYTGHNNVQGCTASMSDAGTSSTDDLLDGVASVTLVSGTKTTTFPIPCIGVAGVCQDTTTASNKCTIGFISSTSTTCTATVTGTGTDNCTCTAQVH